MSITIIGANRSLSNLENVDINKGLMPNANDALDFGSNSLFLVF